MGDRESFFGLLFGHGIFTQNGSEWKASRDLLRPQFMHTRSPNFDVIQEMTECFLCNLRSTSKSIHKDLDLEPFFFRFTFCTSSLVFFGASLMKLSGRVVGAGVSDALTEALDIFLSNGALCRIKLLPCSIRFYKAKQEIDDFIYRKISAADTDSPNAEKEDRYVFLQALLDNTENKEAIRDTLMHTLLAGRDSTAILLSWTMYAPKMIRD